MPMLVARTALSFEQFRIRLDQEFTRSPWTGTLTKEWEGRTVNISGAGCRGFATYQEGLLSGPIELSMPWALMSGRIFDEIAQVFRLAGCDEVRIG